MLNTIVFVKTLINFRFCTFSQHLPNKLPSTQSQLPKRTMKSDGITLVLGAELMEIGSHAVFACEMLVHAVDA